jgi:dTDP-4-amino-4,6-dideoxygalactose transaminase
VDVKSEAPLHVAFNRPAHGARELEYVREALSSHASGDGPFTKRAEKLLAEEVGVARALLTTSCTHALEMSALLLDVGPGDEVVVPAFTFVSTANAFALRGARIVFADVRADTLNLDETRLEAVVGPRTKAIVPVHYGGVGCEMDAIDAIAKRCSATIIEDNAHGLFGRWKGRALGTFGALATQSFHETKNFSCGEGGALLVNDPALAARAEILREKGTNRSRFFRGEVDKYTWVDLGSSYVLSDILAAVLLAQLEERRAIQERRRRIWETYARELAAWAARSEVVLPTIPDHAEQTYHVFYALLPDLARRTAFLAHMAARGVKAIFHYVPLHLSPMGLAQGGKPGDCPVTESVSDRLVRLPLFADLSESALAHVVDAVTSFR